MTVGYGQGLAALEREIDLDALPVTGDFPAWLDGTLVRNGPARFELGRQTLRHWFDGLAMLHRFSFHAGTVSYANRYLRSPDYTYATEHGKLGYSQFATDPCRSLFKRVTSMFSPQFGHNASVNVSMIADRFVAWTETPLPVEFDPRTLRTLGVFDFDDDWDALTTTPHPHTDPANGDALNNTVKFGAASAYKVYRIPTGARRRVPLATLPVKEPAYMHSFSQTARYVVLAEYPFVVNPLDLVFNGVVKGMSFAENLRWKPEQPTTFIVIDKGDGAVVGRYPCDPFFSFHHVNAFERDDELVLDLLAYQDASVVQKLYLDVLRHPEGGHCPAPPTELRRYRLPLRGERTARASYEVVSRENMELPRINDARCNAAEYRYMYASGTREGQPYAFQNQLVKVDTMCGDACIWYAGDCYPGEPVFVPAPDARAEDDGVVLSVVLDAPKGTSFLLVLDAHTFAEIARAEVPHHIPFGFHGQYFPGL